MAIPDLSSLLEDPGSDVQLDIVPDDRRYQTSNIIIQDKTKDGLLSFLSENSRYGSTESPSPSSVPTTSNTGGY